MLDAWGPNIGIGGETYLASLPEAFLIDRRAPQDNYTAPDAGQWDVLWFHFCGATAGRGYQAFLAQTQGRAAASLPVDSPVLQMSALLALAGRTAVGLARDLDASALMTAILLQPDPRCSAAAPATGFLRSCRRCGSICTSSTRKITRSIRSQRAINISKYHLQRVLAVLSASRRANIPTRLRLTRAMNSSGRPTCRCLRSPPCRHENIIGHFISVFLRLARALRPCKAVLPPLVAGGMGGRASSSAASRRYSPGRSIFIQPDRD